MFDTQWGMPGQPWFQQGSFLEPATPPLDDVDAGDLVQLPCVNKQWVALITVSLQQLRNPTTWGDLPDKSIATVLDRVDKLLQMIGDSPAVGCCTVAMQLTSTCELQFSTDGGTTWTTVTDWDANLHGCIIGNLPPVPPPNPGANPHDQNACNLAGYLAVAVLQATIAIAQGFANVLSEVGNFVASITSQLAAAYPEAQLVIDAAHFFWDEYVAGVRSHFTDASTDTLLWSDVTCAIFDNIVTVGYVDGTNLAAVRSAICAISYTHADVITALCAFVDHLPLAAWQLMQVAGALDDVDCSNCTGTWCYYWDFTLTNGGWTVGFSGGFGNYVSGVGWEGVVVPGDPTHTGITMGFDMGLGHTITEFQINISSNQGGTSGQPHQGELVTALGTGSLITAYPTTFPANAPGYTWESATATGSGQFFEVGYVTASAGSGFVIIAGIQLRGTGPNPFGMNNCVVGP